MGERLPKGQRIRIRETLKPQARDARSEEEAWQATEEVLRLHLGETWATLEPHQVILRGFHRMRWDARNLGKKEFFKRIDDFQDNYPDQLLEELAPAFRIISSVLPVAD